MAKVSSGPGGTVNPEWFAIAVQALVFLARSDGMCPSATIAGNLRSHAVFMRRVLAQLVRAGIVDAREGRDGGYRLGRPVDHITLADVYQAVKGSTPCGANPMDAEQGCPLGTGIDEAFAEIMSETEARVVEVLEAHTVGALVARAVALGSPPPVLAASVPAGRALDA